MNNKKSIFSIVLSFIIAFAMIFGITLNVQAKNVSAENDEYIKFDVKVENEESISVPAGYADAFTVTYTVTETTGVDALQLRLGYNHTAFTLTGVTTNNATTLGTATKGQENYLENVVYENTNTEGASFIVGEEDDNVLLITATFTLKNPTPATAYVFNLYNANDEEELDISYSTAWRIDTDDQTAETTTHAPVEIQYDNTATVYVQGTYDFSLSTEGKVYDGLAADDEEIEITVEDEDDNAPTLNLVWFDANYNKLTENPTNVGTYYVVAETEGNEYWQAYAGYTGNENDGYTLTDVEGKVATYTITAKSITITANNQNAVYTGSEPVVNQTAYTVTGATISSGVTITKVTGVNAGTYTLTPSYTNTNYTVNVVTGTFTITAKNVTVVIADKSSAYGTPTIELTYTIDENTPVVGTDNLGITLSTTATSSSNVGTYPITGSATNGNYNVTFRNTANTDTKGTYTITSRNISTINFFSGDTVTYDAQSHDLLIVDANKPDWVSYTAENNNQTNANTYQITITVTTSTQNALNYLSSDLIAQLEQTEDGYKYVTIVEGKINPKAITVTADNKSHAYGNTPATLTPVTVGLSNEVNVTFTVKDGNNNTITLSTSTPVGTYSIVPSATSTNYAFTFNNGTYTVSKASPVLSLIALDTEYNSHFYFADASITVGNQVLELDGSSHENDYGFEYRIEIYNANNQKVLNDAWISENYWLDAGEYTAKLVLVGTDNYDGAVYEYISEDGFDTHFTIEKVLLGAPEIEYNGATATWSWEDDTVTDCDGNELHNSTVTYTIGGTEYTNGTFTATAKGNYTLVITPSNTNYLVNEVDLNPVYSVTFTEGTHTANTATPSNMPAVQYVFEGEQATQPATNPSLTGYTFNGWDFDFSDYIIEDMVDNNGNLNIPALWTIGQRTITVIVMHSGSEYSGTFTVDYNSAIDTTKSITQQGNLVARANLAGMIDTQYDKDGMHYTFANSWNYKVTGSEAEYAAAPESVNATENYTFIAVYTATPIVYEITYYFSIDGADYTESIIENDQYTSAAYGSTINYVTPNSQKWFRVEAWYLDEERTQAAPETMPAQDITVYGALVFNVGKGDVNGDGNVDANDITLYRRWIVGGYEITELLNNEALYEASELETEDPSNTVYFIARVADTNAETYEAEVLGDGTTDIRDVSTIRMGLVGGYGFSIVEGKAVTGEDLIIARDFVINDANDMLMLAASGAKVTLSEDITDATLDAEILDSNKDIIIDLNGHTLTLKSFRVTLAEGNTGKILVTNGRVNVSDGNGVYLTAVDGSVHLDDVTLYDDNGLFVIQTADHSLHLFNVVRFLKKEIVNNEPVEAPAQVLVIKDSHIVVEEDAQLEIEKVVVAEIVVDEQTQEEEVVPVQEESDAQITITNNSAEVAEVVVEGDKFENVISNQTELLAAAAKGGEYKVVADFTVNQMVTVDKALTLNGENHTITFNKQDNGNYAFNVDDNYTAQVIAEFNNLNIVSTGYQVAILLNSDFHSTLTLNNVDITCDGECVYSNGLGTVNATGCEFTHEGEYATGKDFVYYSALIVGYGGTINAEDCEVLSFGNGVATFPSGGFVNLVNTNIEVNDELTSANAGYAVWARNEDYATYPEYCRDSIIKFDGCEVTGKLKITDKYTEGSKNKYASKIVAKNSTLSDTNVVIDSGVELVVNTVNGETTYSVAKRFVVTNEEELRAALANKDSLIVFGDNISSTDGYLVNYNTTIDLGGYTLTVTSGSSVNSRAIKIATGAELTVINGTVDAQGTKDTGCYGAFRAEVNSTLNLKDLTLKNYRCWGLNVKVLGATATLENVNITSVWGGGIEVTDDDGADGTVTGYAVLNNCVMTQEGYYDHCSTAVSVSGNSTLDVYSTSYTGEYGLFVFSSGGTINVYGGEFTATGHNVIQTTYDAGYGNDAIVNIYDGEFVGTYGIGNSGHEFLNIYGGTFDHDPTAYLAEGYYAVEENGVYTVGEYGKISTIEELDAATAVGGFWQLVADLDYSTTYTVRNARDNGDEHVIDLGNMTLDLNGHTISTINATVEFSGNGATIKNGTFDLVHKSTTGGFQYGSYALIIDNNNLYGADATVTVENVTCNGGVNVCSATVILNNVNAQTTGSKYYTVWAEQNANVIINSGNYVDAQASGKGVLATGTGAEGGATITVNGGTFTANNKLVYNAEANSIQIQGGSFTKDPTTYVAEGYCAVEDNGVYTVLEGIIGTGEGGSGFQPGPGFPL